MFVTFVPQNIKALAGQMSLATIGSISEEDIIPNAQRSFCPLREHFIGGGGKQFVGLLVVALGFFKVSYVFTGVISLFSLLPPFLKSMSLHEKQHLVGAMFSLL